LARAQIEDRISPTGSDACRKPRESDGGTLDVTQNRDSRRESEKKRDRQTDRERERKRDRGENSCDKIISRERYRPADELLITYRKSYAHIRA